MTKPETMTIQSNESIPYVAYEAAIARLDHTNKRLWILILLLIAVIGFLVWRDMQYEDVVTTETVTQDSGDGGSNTFTGDFVGGDYYGETNSNTDN